MKLKLNTDVYDDIRRVLGRKVRRFRTEAGLSQFAVAEHCGIFRTYLSRIENGTANPTFTVLVALAKTLGVSLGDLLKE
jgi:transcriptional regulator with XRE-family HTH domain